MGFKVAVAGATGNVGREMLDILVERRFPADEVVALASSRSIGTDVSYGDKTLKCRYLDTYDFAGHRHLPHVGRRSHLQGMVAQNRRRRLRRH